jgi:hypothetical protein
MSKEYNMRVEGDANILVDVEEFQDNYCDNLLLEDHIMRYYVNGKELKNVPKKRTKKRKVSQ